jgi:hypothetical protein
MENIISLADAVRADLTRRKSEIDFLKINGIYRIEHFRAGRLINKFECQNTVTTEGKRYLLSTGFSSGTAKATWYIGLVDNGSTHDTPSASLIYDTFFDVTHNTELTNYSGGARKEWVETIDGGGLAKITNVASKAAFTFTSGGVIYGAALVSNSTQSHHTAGDYLMSYSAFTPSTITVVSTDVLNVEVELSFT